MTLEEYLGRVRQAAAELTDADWLAGKRWYADAHEAVLELADRGLSHAQAAALVAVLSPACSWERNLVDANNMLSAYMQQDWAYRPATYGKQVAKARRILADCWGWPAGQVAEYIFTNRGPKTRAFYWNLLHPDSGEYVTVDRWVCRALWVNEKPSLKEYGDIAAAMCTVAADYGVRPCQLQAAMWVHIRK